jgi:hypothetical protein
MLRHNADEWMMKAQLTATDFSLPNRFEKSKEYFEKSVAADKNTENLWAYAIFLYEHNQFKDALPILESLFIHIEL